MNPYRELAERTERGPRWGATWRRKRRLHNRLMRRTVYLLAYAACQEKRLDELQTRVFRMKADVVRAIRQR